jgi:hypothetical protein
MPGSWANWLGALPEKKPVGCRTLAEIGEFHARLRTGDAAQLQACYTLGDFAGAIAKIVIEEKQVAA